MHEIPQVGVSLLKHYDESFQADRNRFDHVGMMTNPGFFKKSRAKVGDVRRTGAGWVGGEASGNREPLVELAPQIDAPRSM